jgi:hypothetical protein
MSLISIGLGLPNSILVVHIEHRMVLKTFELALYIIWYKWKRGYKISQTAAHP